MNHWTSTTWSEGDAIPTGESGNPSAVNIPQNSNPKPPSQSPSGTHEKEQAINSIEDVVENSETSLESLAHISRRWNGQSPSMTNNPILGPQYSTNYTISHQNTAQHPQQQLHISQGGAASYLHTYSGSEGTPNNNTYLQQQQQQHYQQMGGVGYSENQPEHGLSQPTQQQLQMHYSNTPVSSQVSSQSQQGYYQNQNYHMPHEQNVPDQWDIYQNPKQKPTNDNNPPRPLSAFNVAHLNQLQPIKTPYYFNQDAPLNVQTHRRTSTPHSLPRTLRRASISPPNSKHSSSTSSSPVNNAALSPRMHGSHISKSVTKRSRMGCLTCRQRKKRCSENKPKCTECSRLRLNCIWPKPGTEHKNKPKDAKEEENTIDHEIYGKIKVLRGIVEYKSS